MQHNITSNILNILSKLVQLQSIIPRGLDALEFIASYLHSLGFTYIIKTFGPSNEVANLYATMIQSAGTNICFSGHVDVVPPMA